MLINVETAVIGLIGNPIKHSLSPLMHNLVLEKMGINYVYLPFEIAPEGLGEAISALRSLNIRGVNVTIPFKEKVLPYLDDLSEEVIACGAVNVISNENGRLVGYNTDGKGFIAALKEENISIEGKAVFIGAGGAARSAAYELALHGMSQLDFLDTDFSRAEGLAQFIKEKTRCLSSAHSMNTQNFSQLSRNAALIVNCSPVGMYPLLEQSPVSEEDLKDCRAVLCDVIYNPLETKFLRIGQKLGLPTVSGLSMFVNQGSLTLEILLGIKPPRDYMKEVVRNQLAKGIYPN